MMEPFDSQIAIGSDILSPAPPAAGHRGKAAMIESLTIAELQGENARLKAALDKAEARCVLLERLADEDPGTGLANRRAFLRELSRQIAMARRYGLEASLILLDLNGMKSINDKLGHNAGDAVLRHVARLLTENARQEDIVARLGGDEFALLLVETNQAQADAKAARLAAAIELCPLIWHEVAIHCSAAFGACCLSGVESLSEAIAAADQAMYAAKRARRRAAT